MGLPPIPQRKNLQTNFRKGGEGWYPPSFGPQTLYLVLSTYFSPFWSILRPFWPICNLDWYTNTNFWCKKSKVYFGHQNPGYFLSEDGPINGLDPSYSSSHPIFVLSIKFNTSRCFNQHVNLGPGLIQTFPFTQFHCEYIEWGQIAFSNDIHIDRNSCVTLLPWHLLVKKCCWNNYISVVELTFD